MNEERESDEHQQGEIVDAEEDLEEIVEENGDDRDEPQKQIMGPRMPSIKHEQ
jgi:hypothetical protein